MASNVFLATSSKKEVKVYYVNSNFFLSRHQSAETQCQGTVCIYVCLQACVMCTFSQLSPCDMHVFSVKPARYARFLGVHVHDFDST